MAELLKNIYNDAFFQSFGNLLKKVYPQLDKQKFLKEITSGDWKDLELKQRMRRIAETMKNHLPLEYADAVKIIGLLVEELIVGNYSAYAFHYMCLPDFVQVYGLHHPDISIPAMEKITRFSSCEFAVRPFLSEYPDRMLEQSMKWASHEHEMVRRLGSEGTRPRLPWGLSVPWIKKNPEKIIPILELLKNDPSETVRRSVANSLNDIAKDKPDLVLSTTKRWKGISEETDKLIRHASRTLLKRSNVEALEHFGIKKIKNAVVENLKTTKKKIEIGDALTFSFDLTLKSAAKVRIEYGIDFVKANGKTSRKIFKLTEGELEKGTHSFTKKQSFKDFTTRKHYSGKHTLAIIVNGEEKDFIEFRVT